MHLGLLLKALLSELLRDRQSRFTYTIKAHKNSVCELFNELGDGYWFVLSLICLNST